MLALASPGCALQAQPYFYLHEQHVSELKTMKFFCSTFEKLAACDKSNAPRAVFQMFESHSTLIWPGSDSSKLGSEHPIFSWLTGMNNSREDNIVV